MKKLLTLVLVMVLVLTSLTACSVEEITGKLGGVKDAALGVVDTVKKTVGGWLGIEFPEADYETLAGFLIDRLGHIPSADEQPQIDYGDFEFTVLQMDERRVELVHIRRKDPAPEEK